MLKLKQITMTLDYKELSEIKIVDLRDTYPTTFHEIYVDVYLNENYVGKTEVFLDTKSNKDYIRINSKLVYLELLEEWDWNLI